ncbi:MAG: hypothetical protein AAF671_05895 [Pseudomonadota bacterium]
MDASTPLNTAPFEIEQALSTVTAILPRTQSHRVIDAIKDESRASALVWDARGTLLHEAWYKQLLPSISPAKAMIQLLVPDNEVDRMLSTIVDAGRLHLQSTGAVFCTPCEDVYLGADFHRWPIDHSKPMIDGSHDLHENLDVIYYIVEPERSDAISRAAIRQGSHGPIVYFGEGKGLRDRLGWLRITKQPLKEVISVIVESADAEAVFSAMAKAGQVHQPGRGFLYRIPVEKGMFNLPSRVSQPHHAANMQQIINAIDRLNGHTHWRDQEVFSVGNEGKGAGMDFLDQHSDKEVPRPQASLQAIVPRNDSERLTEIFLEAGVAGINVSHTRQERSGAETQSLESSASTEYSVLRCVMTEEKAIPAAKQVAEEASMAGLQDVCLFRQPVAQVATYVPGSGEFRSANLKAR